MIAGTVFNIQKYSIHDGPGIRTTVFFKGCPLACWWCHNPESLSAKTEIVFLQNKCIGCGDCVKSCTNAAITLTSQGIKRNETKCSLCKMCVEACPTGAMEQLGQKRTVAEVMREIEKDNIFYEESGGGVTFSGGEALYQLEFLDALLTACKAKRIHTALDTSGYAPWEAIDRIADKVDLFLYDIKLMDDKKHKKYTGASNKLILENLKKLAADQRRIWIRIPVIPGINDDEKNIKDLGDFLSSLNLRDVYLLPYHNIAIDKYARLGKTYPLPELASLSDKQMDNVIEILKASSLHINKGG
ncbi:trans-4-hydroxy-L-proline dehydratase activase [Sporomusa sphaeroides]|uniref:trans-4-hydroxy-L-proline dehydratase activase n=1 Tax=Sporomusa sphaeroides TaxID=47679 RepID=UPI0025491923|nr:trans-4-hydroxy-L-proline dehydratase activase [Sporomusa sphaeroides]HML33459.1 glycyl-radical enzyme activating protein [Sporomusa sphaeroides]